MTINFKRNTIYVFLHRQFYIHELDPIYDQLIKNGLFIKRLGMMAPPPSHDLQVLSLLIIEKLRFINYQLTRSYSASKTAPIKQKS